MAESKKNVTADSRVFRGKNKQSEAQVNLMIDKLS